jgi:hypothetical protein
MILKMLLRSVQDVYLRIAAIGRPMKVLFVHPSPLMFSEIFAAWPLGLELLPGLLRLVTTLRCWTSDPQTR